MGLGFMSLLFVSAFCLKAHAPEAERAVEFPRENHVLFSDDFEDETRSAALWSYGTGITLDAGRTGAGVMIHSDGSEDVFMAVYLPTEGLNGCLLALGVDMRGEGVTEPFVSWLGIKAMLHVLMRDGREAYFQVHGQTGSFDWVHRGALAHLPGEVEQMTLLLGLQDVAGTVWMDDVKVWIARSPHTPMPATEPVPVIYPPGITRLRGAMVSPDIDAESLRVLGEAWQANVIRWQLGGFDSQGLDSPTFDAELESELRKLDVALPVCRDVGLHVILDMHSLANGLFDSLSAQQRLIDTWQVIANRYVTESRIWAYDLVNEPDALHGAFGEGVQLWEDLAEELIQTIREVDDRKVFVVESPLGAPWTFEGLRLLRCPGVPIVYSAHMYEPPAFTHQTLYGYAPAVYPGEIDGEMWDKARLMEALEPVMAFQSRHDVPIFIGEFSAIRWAEAGSAFPYLRDVLEILEAREWDWCYHAFREWHGWSVEHSENPNDLNPTTQPNARQQLLRSYLELNIESGSDGQ